MVARKPKRTKAQLLADAGRYERALKLNRTKRNAAMAAAREAGASWRELQAATDIWPEGCRKAIAQHERDSKKGMKK